MGERVNASMFLTMGKVMKMEVGKRVKEREGDRGTGRRAR